MAAEDAMDVENLYEYSKRLDKAEDKLEIRVQAIRGLPLIGMSAPGYLTKIVDVLGQLLSRAEENVEHDAVHKALMSLLRQDVGASLTVLFHHVKDSEEHIREKVLIFIKDKVFPLKAELLKPQEQMERHVTDLVKKSLRRESGVGGEEFEMLMDFLKSFSIFGEKAPQERVQELIEIIEEHTDLDSQFNVSDVDHIDRLMSCMHMAVPFFLRGASNSKYLNYLNKHILPVFDKIPEERKEDLLKSLAESSPYTTPHDSHQVLPSVVQLLKKCMPQRQGEEMNFTFVECLLYTFHHLARKTPNATNSLCGYKIVTGQPSDRLGEDFSNNYKDFTQRLRNVEHLTTTTRTQLTEEMEEHKKAMAAAKTEDAKADIEMKKQKITTGLRTCNNILAMTQPLHSKTPAFAGDKKKIDLSWKAAAKPSTASLAAAESGKRTASAANDSGAAAMANKKRRGEGGGQSRLVNRALEGLYRGGRSGGRVKRWGGRGKGRVYR